jgi:LysM repeat protein
LKINQKLFSLMESNHYIKSLRIALICGLAGIVGATTFGATTQQVDAAAASCVHPYTVVAGDTLSQIASHHKTTWQKLASSNHIVNPNLILIGQHICLDGSSTSTNSHPAARPTTSTSTAPKKASSQPKTTVLPQNASVSSMINAIFGPYAAGAMQIATCESGLNPGATNPSSGAAGLFQILPSTWATTSQAASSPYNAYANIQAAHDIFTRDGYSWREWVCQP